MDVFEALYLYLSQLGINLYPDILPQMATYPSVTYQLISTERYYSFQGYANLITYTIQFNVWAGSRKETEQVAKQLISSLHSYTPQIKVSNEFNGYESDTQKFVKKIEFEISLGE